MTNWTKRRERKNEVKSRAAEPSSMFSRCRVIGCGKPARAGTEDGLDTRFCRSHADHYARHGSPYKRSYAATEIAPYRKAALTWRSILSGSTILIRHWRQENIVLVRDIPSRARREPIRIVPGRHRTSAASHWSFQKRRILDLDEDRLSSSKKFIRACKDVPARAFDINPKRTAFRHLVFEKLVQGRAWNRHVLVFSLGIRPTQVLNSFCSSLPGWQT